MKGNIFYNMIEFSPCISISLFPIIPCEGNTPPTKVVRGAIFNGLSKASHFPFRPRICAEVLLVVSVSIKSPMQSQASCSSATRVCKKHRHVMSIFNPWFTVKPCVAPSFESIDLMLDYNIYVGIYEILELN